MADKNDDAEEIEGFSDAEIDEQIAPYLEQLDADYEAAIVPLAKAFKAKGPPEPEE